jgi:hypothetical protein
VPDRDVPVDIADHLLLDHILPLVLARRGHLVLHGAVLALGGSGVVLLGQSGTGKSTLSAYAWRQGWDLLGDDGAVVHRPGSVEPSVEATYGTLRLSAATSELLDLPPGQGEQVLGKHRLQRLGGRAVRRGAVALRALVFLEAADGRAEATVGGMRGARAHAALFGAAFNPDLRDGVAVAATMEQLADLVERVSVVRLKVPRGLDGLHQALDALSGLVDRG